MTKRTIKNRAFKFFAIIAITIPMIGTNSCTSTKTKEVNYGISPDKIGYVPARISVLSCRDWPITSHLSNQKHDSQKNELKDDQQKKIIADLCQKTDHFVLSGFKDQPYMKGFSPRGTKKLLKKSQQLSLLNQFSKVWEQRASDCQDCKNEASFYQATIAKRADWLKWLNQLSLATKSSDAVLIPFVVFVNKVKKNNRGLLSTNISAAVALLLIDTDSGELIWSNQRTATASHKKLTGQSKEPLTFPSWKKIYDSTLTNGLWKDFPGRLIY
jgi:hypothetical protein